MNHGRCCFGSGGSYVVVTESLTDMRPKRSNDGVITYHIPFNIRLLAREAAESKCPQPELRPSAPVKKRKSAYVKQNKWVDTTAHGFRRGTLSYTPTGRLQVKMEAEIQEVKELIGPLLDTEKELETFLSRQDEGKMMRREVMRKYVHVDVWGAIRKKFDHHMAVCNPAEIKMRQNLYQQFLNHGNTKGYVFLDTCDLNKYNPYLLHGEKPHKCKLRAGELKQKELLHERFEMRKTRCEAGCQYKWISQTQDQCGGSVAPVIDSLTVQSADKSHIDHTRSSLNIPFHIRETSALDGTCHHDGCWFSR